MSHSLVLPKVVHKHSYPSMRAGRQNPAWAPHTWGWDEQLACLTMKDRNVVPTCSQSWQYSKGLVLPFVPFLFQRERSSGKPACWQPQCMNRRKWEAGYCLANIIHNQELSWRTIWLWKVSAEQIQQPPQVEVVKLLISKLHPSSDSPYVVTLRHFVHQGCWHAGLHVLLCL